MKLHCPACQTKIPAPQINIAELIAVCGACDEVFRFDMPRHESQPATIPKGIGIPKDGELRWRPRTFRIVGAVLTCLGAVLSSSAISVALETGAHGAYGGFFALLMLGASGTYIGLSTLLNSWSISVETDEVVIRYGPVRIRRAIRFSRRAAQQLYVHQRTSYFRGQRQDVYDVFVQLKGGRTRKLFRGIPDPAVASYLAWYIENELGLTHRPVAGEYVPAPHILPRTDGHPQPGGLQLVEETPGGEVMVADEGESEAG